MKCVVMFVFLLAALASGQWSESVVLGDSCFQYQWSAGPVLVPAGADTIWAVWKRYLADHHDLVLGRRFAGDSWEAVERLTPDSAWYNYPAGILGDSGQVLVAYYEGSYPVSGPATQDSWGIYTVTRTDTGWTTPQMMYEVRDTFPVEIRLGHDRWGGIGMTWRGTGPPIPWPGSVMFSRKTTQGWTPCRCLAGCSATMDFGQASLIPGDSTDFYIAFTSAGLEPPYPCSVQVWTLADTLVDGPTSFAGGSGQLVRSEERRYLVFMGSDKIFASVNSGSGWEAPVEIPGPYGEPTLAVDAFGWAWISWTDTAGQVVLASHNAGSYWSIPETVALCQDGSNPVIASDEYGRIHCCWLDDNVGGLTNVRWSYRLTRPGVEETVNGERGTMNGGPTIVRGVLWQGDRGQKTGDRAELLDVSGRKVLGLKPGANDVRALVPGVYFVRGPETEDGRPFAAVRKVVVTR